LLIFSRSYARKTNGSLFTEHRVEMRTGCSLISMTSRRQLDRLPEIISRVRRMTPIIFRFVLIVLPVCRQIALRADTVAWRGFLYRRPSRRRVRLASCGCSRRRKTRPGAPPLNEWRCTGVWPRALPVRTNRSQGTSGAEEPHDRHGLVDDASTDRQYQPTF